MIQYYETSIMTSIMTCIYLFTHLQVMGGTGAAGNATINLINFHVGLFALH